MSNSNTIVKTAVLPHNESKPNLGFPKSIQRPRDSSSKPCAIENTKSDDENKENVPPSNFPVHTQVIEKEEDEPSSEFALPPGWAEKKNARKQNEPNSANTTKHYSYYDGSAYSNTIYSGSDPETAAKRVFKSLNMKYIKKNGGGEGFADMDIYLKRLEDDKCFLVSVKRRALEKPVIAHMKTSKGEIKDVTFYNNVFAILKEEY